jgi:hypothetical protein
MNYTGILSLMYKIMIHAAIALTGKISFLFGYSLMQVDKLLGNTIMIFGMFILGLSGYILSRGHPRFWYARLIMLSLLILIFLGMLLEANGIIF